MMVGLPPFYNRDRNTEKMFAAIQSKEVTFSSKVTLSADAKDFIMQVKFPSKFRLICIINFQLLKKTPEERLGFKGADAIKKHKWFENIDWKLLNERKVNQTKFPPECLNFQVNPPFKPKITGDYDVDNFDAEFTREGLTSFSIEI